MQMRIAGTINDSIVDGPGFRFTVFTQGCPHHCPGCHNPKTHDFEGGKLADTQEIIEKFRKNELLDGITLSGGEPLCQSEACQVLARAAHESGLNVWCYTGYTFEELMEGFEAHPDWAALLQEVDVLVDGRFILAQRTLEARFRGSKNQRLIDVPASLAQGRAVVMEE